MFGRQKPNPKSLGDKDYKLVLDKVGNNTTEKVWLEDRNMSDSQIQKIAQALEANTSVKVVSFSTNPLGIKSAQATAKLLIKNHTIEYLDVSKCKFGEEGALIILRSISSKNNLRSLVFNENQLGDTFAKELAHTIEFIPTIKHLCFSKNHITDEGIITIAAEINKCKSLETLHLSSNPIGDEGAIKIANVWKYHPTLKDIALLNTKIGELGKLALWEAFDTNLSAVKLYLNVNFKESSRDRGEENHDSKLKIRIPLSIDTKSLKKQADISAKQQENATSPLPIPSSSPKNKINDNALALTIECPITQQIMKDPVIISTGHSFERTAIEQWFKKHDTCPCTQLKVDIRDIKSNYALKSVIEALHNLQPELFEGDKNEQLDNSALKSIITSSSIFKPVAPSAPPPSPIELEPYRISVKTNKF